jgi:hypothetical protein
MANNKPANKYAQPHGVLETLPAMSEEKGATYMDEMNISLGNISKDNYKPTKTSGIKMRGGKAQTKGIMSRGPMA